MSEGRPRLSDGWEPDLLAQWVDGWTVSRRTPAPTEFEAGWKVAVGLPDQRVRYVFPSLVDGVLAAARQASEPFTFIKACASPADLAAMLPSSWTIQEDPHFLMSFEPDHPPAVPPPPGFEVTLETASRLCVARVFSADGEVAASGQIARTGDAIIFDKIETSPSFRRRGLGRSVMSALGSSPLAAGADLWLLVATEDGRALYEAMGWKMLSPLATAVNATPPPPG